MEKLTDSNGNTYQPTVILKSLKIIVTEDPEFPDADTRFIINGIEYRLYRCTQEQGSKGTFYLLDLIEVERD